MDASFVVALLIIVLSVLFVALLAYFALEERIKELVDERITELERAARPTTEGPDSQ